MSWIYAFMNEKSPENCRSTSLLLHTYFFCLLILAREGGQEIFLGRKGELFYSFFPQHSIFR